MVTLLLILLAIIAVMVIITMGFALYHVLKVWSMARSVQSKALKSMASFDHAWKTTEVREDATERRAARKIVGRREM